MDDEVLEGSSPPSPSFCSTRPWGAEDGTAPPAPAAEDAESCSLRLFMAASPPDEEEEEMTELDAETSLDCFSRASAAAAVLRPPPPRRSLVVIIHLCVQLGAATTTPLDEGRHSGHILR